MDENWNELIEEAARKRIWILKLGQDSLGRYYVTAGPSSIIRSINKQLLAENKKQIEAIEELPYKLILDLKLPISYDEDIVKAGKTSYQLVLERINKNNDL